MPIIQMTMVEGRDQKMVEACIKNVARTVQETLNVPLSTIRVYVNEIPGNHFAIGDELKSEK